MSILFTKQVMANRKDEHLSFNETHGRMIEGKFVSYKDLESSTSKRLKDIACYTILIILLLFCFYCFYQIDYKKRSQEQVLTDLNISNTTFVSTEGIRTFIETSFESNKKKIAQLKQWAFDKNQAAHPVSSEKQQTNQSSSLIDSLLDFPLNVKNYFVSHFEGTPSEEQKSEKINEKVETKEYSKTQIVISTVSEIIKSQEKQEVIVSQISSNTKVKAE